MSSPAAPHSEAAPRLTSVQWLICGIAALGFAFDIYELLMLPLIAPTALSDLGGFARGSEEFRKWVGIMFYVPAVCGGIFGLLGGYLTDRLGRRRVLMWSILIYAFSALAAGFSTSLEMLLVLRCTTFIGVCVEFVAAVAWLAELFPNPKQRESVLGWTQAFSSLGGILVTAVYALVVNIASTLPAIQGGHEPWRYMLISGVIPAIPLILIRPFLPESPVWAEKKAAGTLKRPSIAELFQPHLRKTTIVTTIMMACSYGAAFGAIQHLPQIVPGLPQVTQPVRAKFMENIPALEQLPPPQKNPLAGKLLALGRLPRPQQEPAIRALPEVSALAPEQQEAIVKSYPRALQEAREAQEQRVAGVQSAQEIGGLLGRLLLAVLAVVVVSRRKLLWIFQIPGLLLVPLIFFFPGRSDLTLLTAGAFVAGILTVAQFSFWGNYLPRVYPVHLRGTGESFAANIGGRLIGTSAALLTTNLAGMMPPGDSPSQVVKNATQFALAAATVALIVYSIGFITSFSLPEPKPETAEE